VDFHISKETIERIHKSGVSENCWDLLLDHKDIDNTSVYWYLGSYHVWSRNNGNEYDTNDYRITSWVHIARDKNIFPDAKEFVDKLKSYDKFNNTFLDNNNEKYNLTKEQVDNGNMYFEIIVNDTQSSDINLVKWYQSSFSKEEIIKDVLNSRLTWWEWIQEAINSSYNPLGRTSSVSTSRPGQALFREKMLKKHEMCPVTGEKCDAVLEAAHIIQHRDADDNSNENGLLLRADIHRLFDNHLLAFEVKDDGINIVLSEKISNSRYYKELNNNTTVR